MEYRQFRNSQYYVWDNGKISNVSTGKVLKGSIADNKHQIRLTIGDKTATMFKDRVVAECWLGGIKSSQFVAHLDGDKLNDKVDNLKIVDSRKELYEYYRSIGSSKFYNSKPIYKFNKEGKRISEYGSIKEAAELNNIPYNTLRMSLVHKYFLTGKYIFSYTRFFPHKFIKHKNNNIITRFKYFEELYLKQGKSFRQIEKETGINKQHFTCLFWIHTIDKLIYKKLKNNGFITLNGKKTSSFLTVYKYLKK